MAGKIALITGITGQDGSYLTEFLLSKGYIVSYLTCLSMVSLIKNDGENGVELFAEVMKWACTILDGALDRKLRRASCDAPSPRITQ